MNGKPAEMQTDDHDHHAETAGNRADAAEDVVTIPRAEFEALRAAAAPEAPRGDREADADRRLAELDRKAAAWEHAYKAAVRDRELAAALAGTPLVPGAAPQLIRLWREDLDVTEEDGRTTVTARDGRPVDRAVADWLARPEYAHFRPPGTRGGTASTGGRRDAAPPAARNPDPGREPGGAVARGRRPGAGPGVGPGRPGPQATLRPAGRASDPKISKPGTSQTGSLEMLQFRIVVTTVPQNQIFARIERMLDERFYDAASRSFVREIPPSQIPVRNDHGVLSLDLEAAGWEDGLYHLSLHDAAQPNLAAFYGEYVSVNDGMNLFRKCRDCQSCE